MSLLDQLSDHLKSSMKAGDKVRTGVLRMVLSDVKYAKAAVGVGKDLSDDDVVKVISSYHKKLAKSLDDYPEGEAKQAIKNEMAIVEGFLPKKASEADVQSFVTQLLAKTTDRQFGALMKQVMEHFGQAADGKVISKLLKEKLG